MSGPNSPHEWSLSKIFEEFASEDLGELTVADTQLATASEIAAASARKNWLASSEDVLGEQEEDRERVTNCRKRRDEVLEQIFAPFRAKLVAGEWTADARLNDPEAERASILAAAWPYIAIVDWANSRGARTQGQARVYFDIRISVNAPSEERNLQARIKAFEQYLIGEKRAGRRKRKAAFEQIARVDYDLPEKLFLSSWAQHGWTGPGRIPTKSPAEDPE